MLPNKSLEQTAVDAFSSAVAVHVTSRRWLSFLRPKPYARFGVTNHTMKKHIALGLVASTLFVAGCCTTHHVTSWEYRTVTSIDDVNRLASKGWTLYQFAPFSSGSVGHELRHSDNILYYVMKHPKQ